MGIVVPFPIRSNKQIVTMTLEDLFELHEYANKMLEINIRLHNENKKLIEELEELQNETYDYNSDSFCGTDPSYM